MRTRLEELRAGAARLRGKPLLPDVLIFTEAVRYALDYNEFFQPGEISAAGELLSLGQARAVELAAGRSSWTSSTEGPVPDGPG